MALIRLSGGALRFAAWPWWVLGILSVAAFQAEARLMVVPKPPEIKAQAYILVDALTGNVLVEHQADLRVPPASLTKIMTSYIVTEGLERGELGEQDLVYISDDAWQRGGTKSGGSTMFLKPRTQVAVLDLLRGVIIQSGNDASIALAEHMAGTEEAFAQLMNKTAAGLGMRDSHFMNATGLPDPNHYTTARDLAILARATVYDHPAHYSLHAEKEFTYNGIRQPNRNSLLFRDSTVDGLKTGHTEEAGYCLVATAEREGMRLISVVLGAPSMAIRAAESQKLLNYGFRFYITHNLLKGGQPLQTAKVWKGLNDKVDAGILQDLTLTVARGTEKDLTIDGQLLPVIEAPLQQGDRVGRFTVKNGDKLVYEGDLVALHAVGEAGFFAKLWDSLLLLIQGVLQ
jgi:serine-type D-Ala-D-Ala carboxypeptidase (penicillin-binding protein 5/6)